jgi:putative ABC transport system permease protein
MLRGRDFADSDEEGAPRVVIVNQRLAERLWPSADAVGKRLTTDDPRRNPTWMTVVGVVANVKQAEWAAEPGEELYVPFFQESGFLSGTQPSRSYMTLVVRTSVDPLSLAGGVQNAIWRLNRSAAVSDVRSLGQVIASSLRQPRFHLTVMGLFAGFAMVLAAIGIYGVMDYTVRRRTHEIGIRMALGARRAAVLWMVLRQALALVLAGVALGLAAALALTRSLAKLLYGVTPGDPATFAVLPLALVLIAALAAYVPARRAAAVDPAAALRGQ